MRQIVSGRGEFEALQYNGKNWNEFKQIVYSIYLGVENKRWVGCTIVDVPDPLLRLRYGNQTMTLQPSDWLVWRYRKDDNMIAYMRVRDEDFHVLFREHKTSQSEFWRKADEFNKANPDYKPEEVVW